MLATLQWSSLARKVKASGGVHSPPCTSYKSHFWRGILLFQYTDPLRLQPLTELSTRDIFWEVKVAGA